MPPPISSSSSSTIVAEIPAAAIHDGIACTAATGCNAPNSTSPSRFSPPHAQHQRFASYVIAICILSNFLFEVGDFLMRAPFIRLLEAILCRQYWQEHDPGRFPGDIGEKWCKVASVQTDLSMLKGWDLLFSCLPTILLTIPMGIVADKYGRKMLLFMALVGLTLATAWMQIVGRFVSLGLGVCELLLVSSNWSRRQYPLSTVC
jgi:MFS family permease